MRKAKKYLNDNNIHYDTLNGKVKSMIEKILGYTDNEDTISALMARAVLARSLPFARPYFPTSLMAAIKRSTLATP